MRITLTLLTIILFQIVGLSQKISLADLTNLCKKNNWEEVNSVLNSKGWEFFNSQKGDDEHYDIITWSYDKDFYSDKAVAWIHLYTYDGSIGKISFNVFNKSSYSLINNSINSAGYKLVESSIENEEVTSFYENSLFNLEVSYVKRNDNDDYYNSSTTAYLFLLTKKSSIYDPNNGKKISLYPSGKLQMIYTLKDGKFDGDIIVYYENGLIKKQGKMLNGMGNGKFIEYYENGNIMAEYSLKSDKKEGSLKTYFENGQLSVQGNYVNDSFNGLVKEYNEDGTLSSEYIMKNGVLEGTMVLYKEGVKSEEFMLNNGIKNGPYISYYYDEEGELYMKENGNYINDKKNGLWQTFQITNGVEERIEYINYKDDIKDGDFKEYNNQFIEIGTYKNGVLTGSYKKLLIASIYDGDDTLHLRPISPVLCEGTFCDGLEQGKWTYYFLGTTSQEGNYEHGKKTGIWKAYNTLYNNIGDLNAEVNYKDDSKNGIAKLYYSKNPIIPINDDSLSNTPCDITCYFKDDLLHGEFIYKDSSDNLVMTGNYSNGKANGDFSYYDLGNLYKTVKYEYDQMKQISYYDEYKNLYLISKYSNNIISECDFYYNSSIVEKHKIVKTSLGYNIEVTTYTYTIPDTVEITNYILNSKDDYTYRLFKENAIKDGDYKLIINNGLLLSGRYNVGLKSGKWVKYYPDINLYVIEEYVVGSLSNETFFQISNNVVYSGKAQIKLNENSYLTIKIKDGIRNGKTILYTNGKKVLQEDYKAGERIN